MNTLDGHENLDPCPACGHPAWEGLERRHHEGCTAGCLDIPDVDPLTPGVCVYCSTTVLGQPEALYHEDCEAREAAALQAQQAEQAVEGAGYTPEGPSSTAIRDACAELAEFLVAKNTAYGDSALDPVRIMSTADPVEQIRVRMDDKLSRMMRGHAAGEDAIKDLVGYWVILQVAERRAANRG